MAAPYEDLLKSAAYARLCKEHPAEFAPASVFFTHDPDSAIDRRNSFRVKASLVFWAITGQHDDNHMPRANRLLLALANTCHSAIHETPPVAAAKDPTLTGSATGTKGTGNEKKGGDGEHGKDNSQGSTGNKNKGGDGEHGKSNTQRSTGNENKGGDGEHGKGNLQGSTDNENKGGDGEHGKENPQGSIGNENKGGDGKHGKGNPKGSTEPKAEEKKELTDEALDESRKRMVDGIFLVVGFLTRLRDAIGGSAKTDRDAVDESFKSQHMQDIVMDVIKLENQLPMSVLLDVAGVVEVVVNNTLGRGEFEGVKASTGAEYKLGFTRDKFGEVVADFCWYYSPFASKKGYFKSVAADGKVEDDRTLLDCLHQSVAPEPKALATGGPSRMPTARELRRVGVRLQASETCRAEIEFGELLATLKMPALVYDFKLATVALNLLAREYAEQSKPVTRYFQMMNEIVQAVADVKILRRNGVVRGGSAGPPEVHQLIKKIDGNATYPSVYMATDREIQKVKKYHDTRMKNFFVRNRPGVIWASSVAAISVVAIVAARKKRG